MTFIPGDRFNRPLNVDVKPFEPKLDDVKRLPPDLQRDLKRPPLFDDSAQAPDGKQVVNTRGGIYDDGVGDTRQMAPGESGDAATRDALRAAIAQKLERPSYLREPVAVRPQRLDAAIADLNKLLSPRAASSLVAEAKANGRSGAHLEKLLLGTQSLPPALRQSLVRSAGQGLGGTEGAVISNVVASDAFRALSLDQKQKLASVIERLTDKDKIGLERLGAIVEQSPQALLSKDSKGGTLIDNLAVLAKEPLSAVMVADQAAEKLLAGMLHDLANPNSIDQGSAGTCTTASLQYELVSEAPAEYARLLAGLATKGSVTMKGGDKLSLPTHLERFFYNSARADRVGRTHSESLFQATAMEYANGAETYRPIANDSVNAKGVTRPGLRAHEQQKLASQLFGVTYESKQFPTEADAQAALTKLRGFDSKRHVNRAVILSLDAGPAKPGPNGEARRVRHAVSLEKIEGGRVFFRDPHGSLRSFPEENFARSVLGMIVPPGVM